jgi:hypothetical protein
MLLNFHRKNCRVILRNLTEVILPQNDSFPPEVAEEVIRDTEKFIPALPLPLRFGFAVGLYLIEWSPLFFMGKPRRFSGLNFRERQQYIEKWIHCPVPLFRDLMKLIKGLVVIPFYDDPRVMEHLGYFIEDHIRQVNADPPVPARLTVSTKSPSA